jgi:hypothetical protein
MNMKRHPKWFMLIVLLGLLAPLIRGAEYERITTIQTQMQTAATGSGGAATAGKLQASGGGDAATVGNPGPYNIWYLQFGAGGGGRTNILVTGTQHAREWVAYRCVLDAGQYLIAHKTDTTWPNPDTRFDYFRKFKDMTVSKLLANANIYMVPVVNPAGYDYSLTGLGTPAQEGWRKNRRDVSGDPAPAGENNGPPAVPNPLPPLVGVDLNRNYPTTFTGTTQWGTVTYRPGQAQNWRNETTSQRRWQDVYCGHPANNNWNNPIRPPQVEKETDAIVTLSTNVSFSAHIDVHSYEGDVGWAENTDTTNANIRPNGGLSDDKVHRQLGKAAADLIIDPGTNGAYSPANPYPTSGDILQWQYENTNKGCLSMLIEVGIYPVYNLSNFHPTTPTATQHAAAVLPGQLFLMFCAVDKSFSNKPGAQFSKP